jgi:hypothetical protein
LPLQAQRGGQKNERRRRASSWRSRSRGPTTREPHEDKHTRGPVRRCQTAWGEGQKTREVAEQLAQAASAQAASVAAAAYGARAAAASGRRLFTEAWVSLGAPSKAGLPLPPGSSTGRRIPVGALFCVFHQEYRVSAAVTAPRARSAEDTVMPGIQFAHGYISAKHVGPRSPPPTPSLFISSRESRQESRITAWHHEGIRLRLAAGSNAFMRSLTDASWLATPRPPPSATTKQSRRRGERVQTQRSSALQPRRRAKHDAGAQRRTGGSCSREPFVKGMLTIIVLGWIAS